MADTAIKPEIKLDPATSTPPTMSQLEEFEDDIDLHIPPLPPDGPQGWLVKVPTHLWEAWADIYRNTADAEPIEIGKMRVYNAKEGENPLQQKIQIRLNAGPPQHQGLPLNYNLDLKSQGYGNTVVFSEKDLPGHQSRGQRSRSHLSTVSKSAGIPSKSDRYGQNQQPVKPGHYRTAIPKQTALAPIIHHVADAAPVEDASYFVHFRKHYLASVAPKKQTTFQTGIDRSMHPGSSALSNFSSFGLTSRPSGRKAPPKEKAVRMSQGDLLDRIYQCFRRYRYWSLKALKNELRQPENFIKSTLDSIAVLVRSGDFAMNYKLKDEHQGTLNMNPEEVKEEAAMIKSEDEGSLAEDGDMEGDEDEDLDDFEDVKMGGIAPRSIQNRAPSQISDPAIRPMDRHDSFIAAQTAAAQGNFDWLENRDMRLRRKAPARTLENERVARERNAREMREIVAMEEEDEERARKYLNGVLWREYRDGSGGGGEEDEEE